MTQGQESYSRRSQQERTPRDKDYIRGNRRGQHHRYRRHRTNLANTIRGLKTFDESNPADFKAWMKKFCVVIGVIRRDILPLLKGEEKPTDTVKIADCNRANEDLYGML